MDEHHWVPVGRVVRAHGFRGAVKIFSYGDTLGSLKPGDCLYFKSESDSFYKPLRILKVQRQKRLWIVHFREVTTEEQARAMMGVEIALPADKLPDTEEGEYYYFQLIGLQVETKEGIQVGKITGIMETGAHDVYMVTTDSGREVLIPAVAEIISEVNLERKKMIIDPPKGLIDDL